MEIADLEIKRAAQLSIAEIGLGSVGHGFKIPLTGHVLSLNQLAFLLNAINSDSLPKSSTFEISSIAAVMKSFSPAGQKIGPMLSITIQGFLNWLGLSLLGLGLPGQLLGAILLSLWAFLQPLITLLFIYGTGAVDLLEFYRNKISDDYRFLAVTLAYAFFGFLILKTLLACAMVIYSFRTKRQIRLIDENRISVSLTQGLGKTSASPLKAAMRDLFKPVFLFSFILMLVFLWQLNGTWVEKLWLALRPLATALIIFYLLRSPWVAKKLLAYSQKSERFSRVYQKSKKVLDLVAQRATGSTEVSAGRKLE